ncbi:MAG: aldehyde ferredoxin oxidoreductase, partial [Candidatus Hecatellales archaeon]
TAGNLMAFTMECLERKLLNARRVGVKLEFGNADAVLEMLERIAYRRGFGGILAEGVRAASKRLGGQAEKLAVHVKGLEPPGYEPRALKAMALAYAVSPRGACHMRSLAYRPNLVGRHAFNPKKRVDRLSYEGQASLVVELEDFYTVVDCMVYCHFLCLPVLGPILWGELAEVYGIVTGAEVKPSMLREAGSRINSLVRLYNLREGAPSDLSYPYRWLREKLKSGASAGEIVDRKGLRRMLSEYYRLRGWTEKGKPKPSKLKEAA